MVFTTFVLWAIGLAGVCLPQLVRTSLVVGAIALALTQFLPIVHLVVGLTAIGIWTGEGPTDSAFGVHNAAGSAAVTVLTAGMLIVLALFGGGILVGTHRGLECTLPDQRDSDDAAADGSQQFP